MAVTGAYPGALREVLTSATTRTLSRAGLQVQNEARRLAPVDKGGLRGSINMSLTGASPEAMAMRVGSNLEYALGVETGTGIYGPRGVPITPKTKQFLRFKPKGAATYVFAKEVKGRPATPYLAPALKAIRFS